MVFDEGLEMWKIYMCWEKKIKEEEEVTKKKIESEN